MKKTLLLVVVMMLVAGAAMAQVAIGDEVILDTAAQVQGTTVVGSPADGDYSVLVNGWIEAYARVSTYDNWIDFGIMSPTSGTAAAPATRWAFSEAGEATYALPGEDGGQTPLSAINGSTLNFDLAGLQIQTNARLDLVMDFGGYLTRCTSTGGTFAGLDTRRPDDGKYQLRNQMKMALHGLFLDAAADPAQDEDADLTGYSNVYQVPVDSAPTLVPTAYNTWTPWGSANVISDDIGWFEPALDNDPWSGTAAFATDGGRPQLPSLNLVVERGQAQATGTGEAAEIWFTQRILRRGLQDVAGNYRSDMMITLTYREADTQYTPAVK